MASGGRVSPVQIGDPDPDFDPSRYASHEEIGAKFSNRVLLELAYLAINAESDKVRAMSSVAFLDRVHGKPKTSLTLNPGTPPGVSLLEKTRALLGKPELAVHVLALAEAGAELEA
jgi:hypothetical protein